MHSAAAAHGFAYDTMRRAEAYRHPLDTQDPLALQHPLAVSASSNEQQVNFFKFILMKKNNFQSRKIILRLL